MSINQIFSLLALFQVKHFLADYLFQTHYMLGKFKSGTKWVLPLLAHSAVHALMTFILVRCFRDWRISAELALIDLSVHFAMDRVKASPRLLGRFKALSAKEMLAIQSSSRPCQEALRSNTYFWWSLGFDQMVHHMGHYYIIWCAITLP
jgi:hypothetical protein